MHVSYPLHARNLPVACTLPTGRAQAARGGGRLQGDAVYLGYISDISRLYLGYISRRQLAVEDGFKAMLYANLVVGSILYGASKVSGAMIDTSGIITCGAACNLQLVPCNLWLVTCNLWLANCGL